MGEHWDRERLEEERYRGRDFGRDRYDDRDRYYMSGARGRDHSDERFDRDRRFGRTYEDDVFRERRYYDNEPRFAPPPRPARREPAFEYEAERPRERRVVIEKERDYYDDPSPRRPAFLRRQSSLDTYDRRPLRQFYEREELPPPARREDIYREDAYRDDYRPAPYAPPPLPKSRGLPPPPPRGDRRYYDDIRVAEPDYYGDDDYRPYRDRLQERELIRSKRRERRGSQSRASTTHRSTSPSSVTSSRSSSSSSGGTTVRSEYPKKGKTRMPARLVSKRALIDLGYPFTEEGTTIIVQKALGQKNIDELLKLSEDYKKSELEVAAARSSAGDIAEERREVFVPPAPAPAPEPAPAPIEVPPAPAPAPIVIPPPPPAPAPVIIDAAPPGQSSGNRVEFSDQTIVRASSPTDTTTTSSWDSHSHHHHHHHHRHREDSSNPIPVGPLELARRSRSASRSRKDIRAEIRSLERDLVHRPKVSVSDREIVRAERLPDGQLVVYEEEKETFTGPKPPRIEKDKKGRMSISVPKYR